MSYGWCPSVHRPMEISDGPLVRLRPHLNRLTRTQALGLCEAARRRGNGLIDLTNRANLQLRGITDHRGLLDDIAALGLLDESLKAETRRSILTQPFWQEGDLSHRLTDALLATLPDLAPIPAKAGFVIDLGPAPCLTTTSGDIRLERSATGLILRADGTATGRAVTEATALDALAELTAWFSTNVTQKHRRMAQLSVPEEWTGTAPLPTHIPAYQPLIETAQTTADQLEAAVTDGNALRLTPWRAIISE